MIGAVDIGGTKLAVGMVTESGQVLSRKESPTDAGRYGNGLATIAGLLRETAQIAGVEITGIGIGSTGPVDPFTGKFGEVDFLPGWRGQNPVEDLARMFRVQVALENDADAAPTRLGESGGIGVVFQGNPNAEHTKQVFHWILSAPPPQKINFAKLSRERVYRTSGSNSYAGDFNTGNLCRFSQKAADGGQAVRVGSSIGGRLLPSQYLPALCHHADCYFCSADVNRTDHEISQNRDYVSTIGTPTFWRHRPHSSSPI